MKKFLFFVFLLAVCTGIPIYFANDFSRNQSVVLTENNENLTGNSSINPLSNATDSTNNSSDEPYQGDSDKPLPTDVIGHWGEGYIDDLYQMGYVTGYADGNFQPNGNITRAELLKIALNSFGHDVPKTSTRSSFLDVKNSDWFQPYVDYAYSVGIVSGYGSHIFKPNDPVNRGAALKIILETAGFTDIQALTPNFNDVDTVLDWYAKYSAFAKAHDIMSGYSDGTFGGNKLMTRAEACKVIVTVMEYLDGVE